jgi:hypothetical protein
MHPIERGNQEAIMSTSDPSRHMREFCVRITCEYLELPGLALTLPQATHLWSEDAETCMRALDRLVASGFLRSTGGAYRRDCAGYRAV